MRHIVSSESDGERLDRVVSVAGNLSRSAARTLVESESVTVDGELRAPRYRVSEGDVVEFELPEAAPPLEPEEIAFDVRYEDEHVAVVDKPPGLVVHPGAGQTSGTLAGGLLDRYPAISGVGVEDRWGLVHRLDKDTSGLLVVALTDEAYAALVEMIRSRRVSRYYLALVDGAMGAPTGTIDAPIGRDPARPTRRRIDPIGRASRTHYEVLEHFESADVSLLSVQLETGRNHQIRVHFAGIDHPLVGDKLYRPGPDRVPVDRLFLHAARLEFEHPVTGEAVDVRSDLPEPLSDVVERLRRPRGPESGPVR